MTIWTWLRAAARPPAIVLSLGFGLAGCQVVPGDGPWMGGAQASSTEALPFDVIDLTPTSVVAYRPMASVDRPSTTSRLSAGGHVSVAPGDVLKVRIFEPYEGSIFPTIQRPGADLGTQRVTDEGTINIPYVGSVAVAGLDLSQIEQRILPSMQGMEYIGPDYDKVAQAYRLKFIRNGTVIYVDVDARSGAILNRSH